MDRERERIGESRVWFGVLCSCGRVVGWGTGGHDSHTNIWGTDTHTHTRTPPHTFKTQTHRHSYISQSYHVSILSCLKGRLKGLDTHTYARTHTHTHKLLKSERNRYTHIHTKTHTHTHFSSLKGPDTHTHIHTRTRTHTSCQSGTRSCVVLLFFMLLLRVSPLLWAFLPRRAFVDSIPPDDTRDDLTPSCPLESSCH